MKIRIYKNVNVQSEINPFKKRDKVNAQCQQCDAWKENITIIVIDRSIKKRGNYICASCASKNSRKQASEKIKQTNLKRYGTEVASKSAQVKAKYKKTCMEKYGVESTNQLEYIKQKKIETCQLKYGVDNPFQLESVKKMTKDRNLNDPQQLVNSVKQIYKVDNITQLAEIKSKIRESNFKKYGYEFVSQVPKIKEKIVKNRLRDSIDVEMFNYLKQRGYANPIEFGNAVANFLEINDVPANSKKAETHFESNGTTLIKYLRLSNNEHLIRMDYRVSSKEIELANFIGSIYKGTLISNDTTILKPKELDIYLPELGVAFEFNGLIWHSELFKKDKNYHFNKYKNCLEKDIKLYTIWEHQWDDEKGKIKQFIESILLKKETIYARKCKIVSDEKILKKFIKDNHLQELGKSFKYLGLSLNNEIVIAASFGKHPRNKNEIILNRVCYKNKRVIGGLERLLKNSGFSELFTWSDNCYSPLGNMYKNANFEKILELSPDYFYTDGNNAFSKQSRKKSNIKCPVEQTEKSFNESCGLYRIWDCGKVKWKWTK